MVLAQYVPEAEVEGEREWEDHLYRVQQQDVSLIYKGFPKPTKAKKTPTIIIMTGVVIGKPCG